LGFWKRASPEGTSNEAPRPLPIPLLLPLRKGKGASVLVPSALASFQNPKLAYPTPLATGQPIKFPTYYTKKIWPRNIYQK